MGKIEIKDAGAKFVVTPAGKRYLSRQMNNCQPKPAQGGWPYYPFTSAATAADHT